MLSPMRTALAAALAAAFMAPASTGAQGTAPPDANSSKTATTAAGEVISSHQIDRFEAIRQLRESLQTDSNNLADWIILGELSQEVATEVPADQAGVYYRMASQAFENAQKLRPEDPALQSAARFARDQEADAARFDQARGRASATYLAARRRELAEGGPRPTLRVYSSPAPVANAAPVARAGQPAMPAGRNPAPQPYGQPTFRPYTSPAGDPYTYDQYSQGFYPPSAQPGQAGPAAQPAQTLRQYSQQLPDVLMNEAMRRATGTPPGAAPPQAPPR